MPNWCSNHIVVTGPVEEITRFKQTCIRRDEKGESCFDFNRLIPMPEIIKSTIVTLDDIGPDGSIPPSMMERMEYSGVDDLEALKEKIGLEALEKAGRPFEAFEQAGAPNWYVWANRNWGTKWNAWDFKVIAEDPERYECGFETAWSPPEPVYVKLAEIFPNLRFEINGLDELFNFDFQATGRDGAFSIHYDDPFREGFQMGVDSDCLLDDAKACGNDPKRFLCVGLCRAVTSNYCNSESKNPDCEKAIVAWGRGDTREASENSCRDVIARNDYSIRTLLTDWQFMVFAPGEIQFQAHSESEEGDVVTVTDDHLPF